MAEKIEITTRYLEAKKAEWLAFAKQAEKGFVQVVEAADKLEQYFLGQPVYQLKGDFLTVQNEGKTVFELLQEHVKKLSEIARVYEEAERSNIDVVPDN